MTRVNAKHCTQQPLECFEWIKWALCFNLFWLKNRSHSYIGKGLVTRSLFVPNYAANMQVVYEWLPHYGGTGSCLELPQLELEAEELGRRRRKGREHHDAREVVQQRVHRQSRHLVRRVEFLETDSSTRSVVSRWRNRLSKEGQPTLSNLLASFRTLFDTSSFSFLWGFVSKRR